MVDEIAEQLGGIRPGCLIVSVGGGGLLLGLLQGMERHGWTEMPIFCLETIGADCFNLSLAAKHIVELSKITR
jgi:L-serine/L-threonine ammonia-lyase